MSECGENAVVVPAEKREIGEPITKELILSYMDSFGIGATLNANEKTQFVNVAVAYRLNPFKREIYCNPYETKQGRKLSIITGYEVYLKRAERIGDLDGWKVTTTGNIKDHTLKAQIVIHRKSWKQPFEHEVEFSEYNLNRALWLDKPITMLKKVVTAQGFRLAFPDELGGMPYTADELPDNMTGAINITAEPAKPHTPPQRKSETAPGPDGIKTAVGFIIDKKAPNKGGFVAYSLEGYVGENGKPTQFSTKDPMIIETMDEHRAKGEKVGVEYTENANPAFANSIVGIVSVQEEAQVGD